MLLKIIRHLGDSLTAFGDLTPLEVSLAGAELSFALGLLVLIRGVRRRQPAEVKATGEYREAA